MSDELERLRKELAEARSDNEILIGKVGSLCLELEGWRYPVSSMFPNFHRFDVLPYHLNVASLTHQLNLVRIEAAEYRTWLEDMYGDENCHYGDGCPDDGPRQHKCPTCSARELLAKYYREDAG